MVEGRRILALDLGLRHMGWAFGVQGSDGLLTPPRFGLVKLPGSSHLGTTYGCLRNALEELVIDHRPAIVRWVPAFVAQGRTSAAVGEGLVGIQAVLRLVCYDNNLALHSTTDRTARKQILGRADFGLHDPKTGALIPNSGRAEAKAAVLRWCEAQGYAVPSHDVGDALVLLHWVEDAERKGGRSGWQGTPPRLHG